MSVLDALQDELGTEVTVGRNFMWGYPVDVSDQDPSDGLAVKPVDDDAAVALGKLLRRKGFRTRYIKNSKELLIMESRRLSKSMLRQIIREEIDMGSLPAGITMINDPVSGQRYEVELDVMHGEQDAVHLRFGNSFSVTINQDEWYELVEVVEQAFDSAVRRNVR